MRAFLFLCLALTGCSYRTQKERADALAGDRPSAELVARVSYNDVEPILRARCVGCHGTSGGVSLESYPQAVAALERIRLSTIVERRMPKSPMPALTAEERLTLAAWIESGGRELPPGGGSANPPPPPLEPKYDSIRTLVLEKKCIFCHSPGGKAARIPMLTKDDLLTSPLDLVIPGNAEESDIVLVLKPGARKPMPPLDSGVSDVTPEEIAVIKEWINRGAGD